MFTMNGKLKKIALSLTLAFTLVAGGCGGSADSNTTQKQRSSVDVLEQSYHNSPRLHRIVEDEQFFKDDAGRFLLDVLVSNHIDLEISSDGLPEGAAIRLFKNRWQINPFLSEGEQDRAVDLALTYVHDQIRDGLPYGVGESFTLSGPSLSSIGPIPGTKPEGRLTTPPPAAP
jgi:hypothetical protein